MNVFNKFCEEHKIRHWRDAFYHHYMSVGYAEFTVEDLEKEWESFLSEVLSRL